MPQTFRQYCRLDELTQPTLADRFETVSLAQGEVLFRQDDPGDGMYLVVEGQLEVLLRDPEGREWLVSLLGRGDFVGEVAMLTGQDRNAMIRAADTTVLQKLSKSAWSFLEFRLARDIAEAGYQGTIAVMDDLTAGLKANGFKIS